MCTLSNSDLYKKRLYQINTIKIFNDKVVEVERDFKYKVNFTCGTQNICLDIELGPMFPYEKPIIRVIPEVAHEWIENGIVVGAPGLNNFNVYSELGRVIQAIISQFKKLNPPLLENMNHTQNYLSHSTSQPVYKTPNEKPALQHQESKSQDLRNMSIEELKLLATNDEFFESYFSQTEANRKMQEMLNKEITNTEELAKENLALKETLDKLVESIANKADEMELLHKRLQSLKKEYDDLRAPFQPENLMEALESQTAGLELNAEKITKDFLNGGMEPDAFLKVFVELRSKGLSQRARQELLRKSLPK